MTTEPEPEPDEPQLSWAEVYRVNTCGNCHKPDCPHCVAEFLKLIREQGTSRTSDAKGLT